MIVLIAISALTKRKFLLHKHCSHWNLAAPSDHVIWQQQNMMTD